MTQREKSHLDRLEDTMNTLDEKFDAHNISDEKRFGRIEKLVILVGIFVVLPKFGAPDASTLLTHGVSFLSTII